MTEVQSKGNSSSNCSNAAKAGRQAGRQALRQAGRQAGTQAGRQAGRQADRQAEAWKTGSEAPTPNADFNVRRMEDWQKMQNKGDRQLQIGSIARAQARTHARAHPHPHASALHHPQPNPARSRQNVKAKGAPMDSVSPFKNHHSSWIVSPSPFLKKQIFLLLCSQSRQDIFHCKALLEERRILGG